MQYHHWKLSFDYEFRHFNSFTDIDKFGEDLHTYECVDIYVEHSVDESIFIIHGN